MTLELVNGPGEGSQTPEEIAAAAQAAAEEEARKAADGGEPTTTTTVAKQPYTTEDLHAFTPTSEIDMDRVPDSFKPIISNMVRDYKELQKHDSQVAAELAETKKAPEVFFAEDPGKDKAFKAYLDNPSKVVGDIYARISQLDAVIDDEASTTQQRGAAKAEIRYWERTEKEFSAMSFKVSQRRSEMTVAETKLVKELGPNALNIQEFAVKNMGYTESMFRSNPAARAAAKDLYEVKNATTTAKGKEVKTNPQATAHSAGTMGGGTRATGGGEEDESNLSVTERIRRSEKRLYG